MENPSNSESAKSGRSHLLTAIALAIIGVAFAATGIFVGEVDDAPGAALIGLSFDDLRVHLRGAPRASQPTPKPKKRLTRR